VRVRSQAWLAGECNLRACRFGVWLSGECFFSYGDCVFDERCRRGRGWRLVEDCVNEESLWELRERQFLWQCEGACVFLLVGGGEEIGAQRLILTSCGVIRLQVGVLIFRCRLWWSCFCA
jgi:hypothetical protein